MTAEAVNTNISRIFTGWDRSTGYITSDLNVYGTWENSRNSQIISNEMADENSELSDLNEADLYAYSRLFAN